MECHHLEIFLTYRKRIFRESVKEGKHACLADSVEKKGEEYYKVVVANGGQVSPKPST
jgi:hypothetical protein